MNRYDAVRSFYLKHGFTYEQPLVEKEPEATTIIRKCAAAMGIMAEQTLKHYESLQRADPRLLRAHLLMEELAEALEGLGRCDRVLLLDGLSDLDYVNVGTAVAYGLPIEEGFDEVHRSNMSKATRKPGDTRLRDKGPDYSPPDLAKVLALYRRLA